MLGFILALGIVSGGCTKKQDPASGNLSESASAQASSAPQAPRVVNLAIWSNYVSPEVLADFEKKTGIKVQISNYSSNEEILAKLQAGASGYDVVVPSDYMVAVMSQLGLLKELNRDELGNSKRLDPRFLKKKFDPENKVSLPYTWGTTGIAVNPTLYKGEIKSWKAVFNQPELAGKLTLLDDVRETLGAALKSLGLSLNSKNPDELKRAKDVLMKARKRVKAFTSETLTPLTQGETAVAHSYVGDTLQASRATQGKIKYVIPEEGATLWIDNLVIPSSAANVKEAHELINYFLDPQVNAATVQAVLVAPANQDVFGLLPPELQKNDALFPSDAVLKKLEMMEDLGEATTLWDRIWTEVKADAS